MKLQQEIKPKRKKAILYCRVSSTKQKTEGQGLDSQEHRCRQYAAFNGYGVDMVFPDDVTGGGDFMKRPGMAALLRFLDDHPEEDYVVIFDDLKRFARDTQFHFKLRHELAMRGARVECLNFRFEDTPEGEFIETVFAAHGQLERKQNGRQVIQKMKARIEKGYYCFAPVLGYRYTALKDGGKVLAPDEPNASIVREALEGYASGRFKSPSEVKRFMETFPSIPKNNHGEVRLQLAIDVLKRPLYAGYITVEKWGIHLQPAQHEPLINFATWQKIQGRLKGKSSAPVIRKKLNEDFPLRGFVKCGCCGHHLTAAWSKGRNRHYAYYTCQGKGCDDYKKSIRKDQIEGDFEKLLKELQPAPKLFQVVREMFVKRWNEMGARMDKTIADTKLELARLEHKSNLLMDRLVEADSMALITAYEKQIKKVEETRTALRENITDFSHPRASFDQMYRTACAFLANPWKLWASDIIEYKRLVLRLAFPQAIAYCRDSGYRTAAIAEPFRLLQAFSSKKYEMVGLAGLEPARPYGQQILSLQRLPFRHRPISKRCIRLYKPDNPDMQLKN